MIKISVIVPVYNAQAHLATCLDSLLTQTYPRHAYEILLIDNNSTDASRSISCRYEGVQVLTESRQGAYVARNRGIAQARGEILAFTDPDCQVFPDWLSTIAAVMEPAGVSIVMGRRHFGSDTLGLSLLSMYEAEKASYVFGQSVPEIYFGYTNNMAVRRPVFDRVGLFPERVRGGDTLFVQAVVQALGCQVIHYCEDMVVRHLEITGLKAYYHKRAVYGQSNARISRLRSFRHLSQRERWRVFTRVLRKQRYYPFKALLLFVMLMPGAIMYDWGRWQVMKQRRNAEDHVEPSNTLR